MEYGSKLCRTSYAEVQWKTSVPVLLQHLPAATEQSSGSFMTRIALSNGMHSANGVFERGGFMITGSSASA